MFPPRLLVLSLSTLSLASARNARRQDNCPEVPETGVTIGEPVPMIPEHIPQGCSDFEILVGEGETVLSSLHA